MTNRITGTMLITTEIFYQQNRVEKKLGSSPECDIVIPDESIDPFHLLIVNTPDGNFKITDQGSKNGTYVMGRKISKVVVEAHDVIQIGTRPVDMRWISQHFEDLLQYYLQNLLSGRI